MVSFRQFCEWSIFPSSRKAPTRAQKRERELRQQEKKRAPMHHTPVRRIRTRSAYRAGYNAAMYGKK